MADFNQSIDATALNTVIEQRKEMDRLQQENHELRVENEDLKALMKDRSWGPQEMDGLRAKVEELEKNGSPGVMHEIDQAFYDLTVIERDQARARVEELESELHASEKNYQDATGRIEVLEREQERRERVTAEHLGELVGALGINPPGEDVMTHWPELLTAASALRAKVEELERPIPHTFGHAIRRVVITEDDEIIYDAEDDDVGCVYLVSPEVMSKEIRPILEGWDQGTFITLEQIDAAVATAENERVSDPSQDIYLKASEVEELERELDYWVRPHVGGRDKYVLVTLDQIDAAWEEAMGTFYVWQPSVLFVLGKLGIKRCDGCNGRGGFPEKCHACNGNGWIKE